MISHYSISEIVKNIYSFITTRIFMRQARFVRRPVYIRGKKSISGCEGLTLGRFCRFDLDGNKKTLFIGKNCQFGDMTHIVAHKQVIIGDNVLIASKCFISDTDHGCYSGDNQDSPEISPNDRKLDMNPTTIGNNVWIGENTVILGGAKIGDGCIIGANSVVKGQFEKETILAGIPAKAIKRWNKQINKWEITNERY